ncbi:DUF6894 family protein [Devosia submarina]|uniref:DUF6894 family protein n=1 Tax=Devosia submarina TaxID=1173082 RepID=UPI000D39B731|nr:hypothetical protein [Devosia submarina]
MPRYFFDIKDDKESSVDSTGIELPNMDAAIREARRALAEMVGESLRDRGNGDIAVRIRDGAEGPVLLEVSLSTTMPDGKPKQK